IYTWIGTWDRRTSVRRYAVTRQRKLIARGETCWTFVELASGRACELPVAVTEAFFVVPDDDPELKSLGLARRERGRSGTAGPNPAGALPGEGMAGGPGLITPQR
ncbi:MAG TPA: hypothetical protein VFX81_00375, partial [Burkholderiaceae bacterium]|nr:hypothetical protein [Burkholderiaceae bacterium]